MSRLNITCGHTCRILKTFIVALGKRQLTAIVITGVVVVIVTVVGTSVVVAIVVAPTIVAGGIRVTGHFVSKEKVKRVLDCGRVRVYPALCKRVM